MLVPSASSSTVPRPTFAEFACLTLVVQGATHGWAIGTMLAPDGELGRIWSLSRPLTYRAVDGLAERRLVSRADSRARAGRDRALLKATAAGRRASAAWLETPVAHPRDVRTELLLKLALRARVDLDTESLVAAQRKVLGPAIDALTSKPGDDLVDRWRRENALAVSRFLDQLAGPGATGHPPIERRLRVTSVTIGDQFAVSSDAHGVRLVIPEATVIIRAIS